MMLPMFPVAQPGVEGESEIINMSESVANFPRNLSMVGNPRQHPSASVQEHQTNQCSIHEMPRCCNGFITDTDRHCDVNTRCG